MIMMISTLGAYGNCLGEHDAHTGGDACTVVLRPVFGELLVRGQS